VLSDEQREDIADDVAELVREYAQHLLPSDYTVEQLQLALVAVARAVERAGRAEAASAARGARRRGVTQRLVGVAAGVRRQTAGRAWG
jgi:hypothetical protein